MLADLLRAADPRIHVDHVDLLSLPALAHQLFDHIHRLQGGGDVADLSLCGWAIVTFGASLMQ